MGVSSSSGVPPKMDGVYFRETIPSFKMDAENLDEWYNDDDVLDRFPSIQTME